MGIKTRLSIFIPIVFVYNLYNRYNRNKTKSILQFLNQLQEPSTTPVLYNGCVINNIVSDIITIIWVNRDFITINKCHYMLYIQHII